MSRLQLDLTARVVNDLYYQRNGVYQDTWRKTGDVLSTMLQGTDLEVDREEATKLSLFTFVIGKLQRYAASEFTHQDSLRDALAYLSMLHAYSSELDPNRPLIVMPDTIVDNEDVLQLVERMDAQVALYSTDINRTCCALAPEGVTVVSYCDFGCTHDAALQDVLEKFDLPSNDVILIVPKADIAGVREEFSRRRLDGFIRDFPDLKGLTILSFNGIDLDNEAVLIVPEEEWSLED